MKRPLILMVVMAAVALGLAVAAVGRVAAEGGDVPTDHSPVVVTPSSTPIQKPSPAESPGQRSDDDDDDGFSQVTPKPRPIDDDDDDADDSDDGADDD